ncbi:MAG: 4a-hydroxytetrahydrobiopterin dehydratase [Gemmataceae bacterium]|nr:4a-hydroxytetrahydrobiopterin dehydratase [Gemmataceae bacterium]
MVGFSQTELAQKKCQACDSDLPSLTAGEAALFLVAVPGWALTTDGLRIRREWKMSEFTSAMKFLDRVAALAEVEGHHPDFHLTNYRNLSIEIWTHAVGGLTENDFILAAKINSLTAQ